MKRTLLFLCCLLPFITIAQDSTKSYYAVRISASPRIDGILDDEAWKTANVASDFVQSQPVEGSVPTLRSEVRVVYNNNAIYIGAMLYDSAPDSILRELGNRDDGLNADLFRFVFDPYNTRQDAYDFGVYASGVQTDSRFSDYTYDGVWESDVQITDKGWTVEMKIPYSAIRFPAKAEQAWGLQFTRKIQRKNEFDQWALTPNGAPNALNYWGTLRGVTNIDAPVRLSLTPYLSAYVENTPYVAPDGSSLYSRSLSYNAGADLKYGIDERFTLDVTLFPDFGQVQSDNKIKNLSYREVTYDENRPFFNEGIDLFNKQNLFYSRRIGKIPSGFFGLESQLAPGDTIEENPSQVKLLNATKLSGRTNDGLGIGVFNAITDNMYATVKDSTGNSRKVLTEPLTNFNIVVFDQQLGNNSSIYFINTNVTRDKQYPDANVTGSGFTINNKKTTFAIDGMGAVSQKFSKVDTIAGSYQNIVGLKYFIGARKTNGNFRYGLGRSVLNSTFDPKDFGYFTVNNMINHSLYFNYNIYKATRHFHNSYNSSGINYTTNYLTKERTNFDVYLNLYVTLLNYTAVYAGGGFTPLSSLDYNEPRVPGRFYKTLRYYYAYAGFSTDSRKAFGMEIDFNYSNFMDKFQGSGYNTSIDFRYRASDKLSFNYETGFNYDPFNVGFANFDTGGTIIFGGRELHTFENVMTGKYIFVNDMSLALNARHYWTTGEYKRYFTLDNEGDLNDNTIYTGDNNFNYNVFNIDMVYSWQFAPGSILSVVYKNAIETEDQVIVRQFDKNFRTTIQSPQTNSLSIKLLYYLDYLSLRKAV